MGVVISRSRRWYSSITLIYMLMACTIRREGLIILIPVDVEK